MKLRRKMIIALAGCLLLLFSTPVYAHTTSQEGVLAKTYHSKDKEYYIGGEGIGWSIDEGCHTNGTNITYSFSVLDSNLTSEVKSYVKEAASKWSGTVEIEEALLGTGTIKTFNNVNSGTVAQFHSPVTLLNGHLNSWVIEINIGYSQRASIVAHEFGHAIGLNDLYESRNENKLMYGYLDSTATAPTSSDVWGAKVITGVHSSHTWGYKYYDTNSTGNRHVNYCTQCNGVGVNVAQCVYNANNVCKICGTPKGVQPYSLKNSYILK